MCVYECSLAQRQVGRALAILCPKNDLDGLPVQLARSYEKTSFYRDSGATVKADSGSLHTADLHTCTRALNYLRRIR